MKAANLNDLQKMELDQLRRELEAAQKSRSVLDKDLELEKAQVVKRCRLHCSVEMLFTPFGSCLGSCLGKLSWADLTTV